MEVPLSINSLVKSQNKSRGKLEKAVAQLCSAKKLFIFFIVHRKVLVFKLKMTLAEVFSVNFNKILRISISCGGKTKCESMERNCDYFYLILVCWERNQT